VEWLEFGDYKHLKFDYYFITCDTALKDKEIHDNSVYSAFGVIGNDLYLLDIFVGRIQAVEREQIFYEFYNKNSKYPFKGAYIEDKASGTDLIQRARRKKMIIRELRPTKSKLLRADDITTYFETFHLKIDNSIKFKQDIINEIALFGSELAEHDDIVDTIVYAFELAYRDKMKIKAKSTKIKGL
jgi:predicted phage terminase large subunit-like protein